MNIYPNQRVIPERGHLPDYKEDALETFNTLRDGGVVIIPTDVGYGIVSCSAEGIERAFAAKKRKPGHTLGIVGSFLLHTQIHDLPPDRFAITRVLTQDMGMLLAVAAPFKQGHPRLKYLTQKTFDRVVKEGTIAIAIPESPFLTELGRLNDEHGQLMVGSSANISGQGQKFRVEDIEPEVRQAADLVVDYGLQRYYLYERAGTHIDIANMRVLRIGSAYEIIRERLRKWFGYELQEDPRFKTDMDFIGASIKPE